MKYSLPADVESEFQHMGLSDKFCHMPFSTLLLEPDGHVGGCRHKGTEFVVGDLKTHTFDEIWNGPVMRAWRREFLDGTPKICQREVRHVGCNLCPEYNSLLPHIELEEIQKQLPLRLALNLNGKCNLTCRMCHIWKEPNGLYDRLGLWNKIEILARSIRELELLSGEPFVQKDTFRLIQLFSRVNPECLWSITTNGHWKLTKTICESLDKIKFKHLIISLDSLNSEAYPKIRRDGTLSVVLTNIDRLLEYDETRISRGLGPMNIRISYLVQQDNWSEIPHFYAFEKKINRPVFRIFLYEPHQYSLLALSESEREEILNFYLSKLDCDQLIHSKRVILPLLESVTPLFRGAFWLEFKKKQAA